MDVGLGRVVGASCAAVDEQAVRATMPKMAKRE
jgi:hypothetical protein